VSHVDAFVVEGDEEPRPRSIRQRLEHPPGLAFHLVVLGATLTLLYAASLPGTAFLLEAGASLLLLIAAAVWCVRAAGYLVMVRRGRAGGRAAWFAVAPLGGLIVLALLVGSVPLRARWAASEGAFESWVDRAPQVGASDELVYFDVPDRIGLFRIRDAYRQGDAVIFYEATGSVLDDAGFAYLPSGPFPELESGSFEAPHFRHLGGDWYSWTASW
jgi:hypothetical protein